MSPSTQRCSCWAGDSSRKASTSLRTVQFLAHRIHAFLMRKSFHLSEPQFLMFPTPRGIWRFQCESEMGESRGCAARCFMCVECSVPVHFQFVSTSRCIFSLLLWIIIHFYALLESCHTSLCSVCTISDFSLSLMPIWK